MNSALAPLLLFILLYTLCQLLIFPVCVSDCFAAVSASLEDSLASSAKATLQAIGAQEAALQAITHHTQKLKEAMEAEVQNTVPLTTRMWCDYSNGGTGVKNGISFICIGVFFCTLEYVEPHKL